MSTLRSIGYTTLELLLTPLQFGIPNSRLRYYLLAKKSPIPFRHIPSDALDEVWRQIPGSGVAWSDPRLDIKINANFDLPGIRKIQSYLDDDTTETTDEYRVPDKVLEKWGRLFDITKPSSTRTCCFTRGECDSLA